jgi:hypothetical protein
MKKVTYPEKLNRPKVSINEHRVLVDPGKSKKLAALTNKSIAVLPHTLEKKPFSGLQTDSDSVLQQAQQLINARIQEIMNSFPAGKRTKLFNLRFGSVAAIQALDIKTAFKKLGINSHNLNMRLLASLSYHGDTV